MFTTIKDRGEELLKLAFATGAAKRLGFTLLLGLFACGCNPVMPGAESSDPGASPITFARGTVCLLAPGKTVRLRVELAEDEAQRAFGLMERDTLAPDTGMLFIYPRPQPAGRGFWMFRTKIPLDIAYLDAKGRIVAMRQMQPCLSPQPVQCEVYPAETDYVGALEVNQGFFAAHNIAPGARIVRAGEPGCPVNGGENRR